MKTGMNSVKNLQLLAWLNKILFALVLCTLMVNTSCDKKEKNVAPTSSGPSGFQQVNLVSDTAGFGASRIDTNLVNAWGMAIGSTGNFWISAADKGRSVIYNAQGQTQLNPVAIPFHGDKFGGAPTGQVFNYTSNFIIPSNNQLSIFIFASETGTISAWASGDSARTVVDNSASDAVYKGIAIANDGGSNFLYATNFKQGKIDVFDQNFNPVSKPFMDPTIPAGFAPFNIVNINGKLYVTYAKQLGPDNKDDQAGAGNGYVNIFNPNGSLVSRFASQGSLNSPWGVTKAPSGFGQFSNNILIGNFGDGRISSFDSLGNFKGQLQNNGNNITIEGLWDLKFMPSTISSSTANQLFFTAGPDDESHGLFGYLKPQ